MKRLADIHGLEDLKLGTGTGRGPSCLICSDTGWAYPGGDTSKGVIRCSACLERRQGFAPGVPEDERTATLAGFESGDFELTDDNKLGVQQAQFFVQGVHPGLYLFGGVGSGKTLLACAVLNELHRQRQQVRFVRVTALMQQLPKESGDSLLRKIIDVPVLVMDDVGAGKASDYVRSMLQTIFDGRDDTGHRTIWTSNLSLDELAEFMGDARLPSRIAGKSKVVQVDGTDYRLRGLRKKQRRRK